MFFWNSRFFDDPADVGNLISGSSAFSKSSLNIWKFMVHILLKPGLENFEYCIASVWEECNCVVVWAFFIVAFLRDWNENWPFQCCSHWWVFQIFWHIECNTFTASSFRIWKSSTGIQNQERRVLGARDRVVLFSTANTRGVCLASRELGNP